MNNDDYKEALFYATRIQAMHRAIPGIVAAK